MSGRFEPHVLQFLVIDLRLSQQNVPSMHVLLAVFGRFATIVPGFFTGFPIPLSLLNDPSLWSFDRFEEYILARKVIMRESSAV
jgi:hypothetical protein